MSFGVDRFFQTTAHLISGVERGRNLEGVRKYFFAALGAAALSSLSLAPVAAGGRTARKPSPPRSTQQPPRLASGALTAATLVGSLRALGYQPTPNGQFQRLKVEEPGYGYALDLGLSASGDWVVCLAHLAPVGDLTRVNSAPLLALLSRNDVLLGMAFSYNRENARIMLNATVPNRAMDLASFRNVVEGVKRTVRETAGLWNTRDW